MRWSAAGLLAVVLMGIPSAWAGVVSLEVQLSHQVHDGVLELSVDVANRGNEPAYNVAVSVETQDGTTWASPPLDVLQVQARHSVSHQWPVAGLARGSYPLVARVFYADANSYPFSAVAMSQVTIGDAVPPSLWAVLEGGTLRREERLTLRMKNLEGRPQTVTVRLVIPQELTSQPLHLGKTLGPAEEWTTVFRLKNFSAQDNSSYPVYAVIESDYDGSHHTTLSTATMRVVLAPSGKSRQPMFLMAAGVLFFTIVLLNVRGRRTGS